MATTENTKPLGTQLMEAGLINEGQLAQALQIQAKCGGRLAQVLVSRGYLGREDLQKFVRSQIHVGSIQLMNYEVSREAVKVLTKEFALEHEVMAIDQVRHHLSLAMAFPLDHRTVKEVEDMTGFKVNPFLCSLDDLEDAISRHYGMAVINLKDLGGRFSQQSNFASSAV